MFHRSCASSAGGSSSIGAAMSPRTYAFTATPDSTSTCPHRLRHLVDVVLDVEGLEVAGLRSCNVLPLASLGVGLSPGQEGLLCGLHVLLLAIPRLEGRA